MALDPVNETHRLQIEAGIRGRKKGHRFEETLTRAVNALECREFFPNENTSHVYCGNPAIQLLQYIANDRTMVIRDVQAAWLGGLATSGLGDLLVDENGQPITKCKSDVLLKIKTDSATQTVGISVKTCNKKTPTNDQMFFTTARAFCQLLRTNGIPVSDTAEVGLSMFCGDPGFRPLDHMPALELAARASDPHRYYWEEMPPQAQKDWKDIFDLYQDKITLLLFQKAYKEDPYPPDYLLHQTVKYDDFDLCETAIFSMDEIVALSRRYSGYTLSAYVIHKGTYKNDSNVHLAPRFGFIQFQRGGQKQHPTQLQFNLKAGYFRHV